MHAYHPPQMTDEEIEAECDQVLEECRRDAEQRDEAFHIQGGIDRRQRLIEQLTTEVVRIPKRTS